MIRYLANLQFAVKGILRNKVRSFLTLLGILIGIGSVIALQAIGEGAQKDIVGELEALGSDVITVNQMMPNFNSFDNHMEDPTKRPDPEEYRESSKQLSANAIVPLTIKNYKELLDKEIDGIKYISLSIDIEVDAYSKADQTSTKVTITAVDHQYFDVYSLKTTNGELFNEEAEMDELVAVIGSEITKEPYYDEEEKVLYMEDQQIEVIGILDPHEPGIFEEEADLQIFIPYTQVKKIGYESEDITLIVSKADGSNEITEIAKDIENTLIDIRDEDPEKASFSVFTVEQLTSRISMITDTFTLMLSAIAAISLLVGGIGIGNVMLISVAERVREIGIRKAIGAKNSDILLQFLLEAVFLSMIGGALGIASGYGIAYLVQRWIDITPVYSINDIIFATGISILVGVVCGFLPALRASRLNPIDALRYE